MYVYFIAAESKDQVVSIAICLSNDPETHLAALLEEMPFHLRMMGVEHGDQALLERLRARFSADRIRGMWYKPSTALNAYITSLGSIERQELVKRVSLDLSPQEFVALENLVESMGTKTKARLLRKAFVFYKALHQYKSKGYLIQAIKGGSLVQFPDLDDIR